MKFFGMTLSILGLTLGLAAKAETFSFNGGTGKVVLPEEVGQIISAEIVVQHSYINGPDIRITGAGGGPPRGYKDLIRVPVEIQRDGTFTFPNFSFDRPLGAHFLQGLLKHNFEVEFQVALINQKGNKILVDRTPLMYDVVWAQKNGYMDLKGEFERRIQFRQYGDNNEYRIGGDPSPRYRELNTENLEMLGLSREESLSLVSSLTQAKNAGENSAELSNELTPSLAKCVESINKK